MAAAGLRRPSRAAAPLGEPSIIHKEDMMAGMMGGTSSALGDNGTSLIARAEALNAFMKMQPAANQARHARAEQPIVDADADAVGCFCFGASGAARPSHHRRPVNSRDVSNHVTRPKREYYPDNLSVQPEKHPWTPHMEWLILACVDFLEADGLDERNLFAVSAVDDLVRNMSVDLGSALPRSTDPHVAAGVIKAQIRHANEPLISKECLRDYIEAHPGDGARGDTTSPAQAFAESRLYKTIEKTERLVSPRRAFILSRIMRLLGRVSANVEVSKMNAHCLAKCVAPSMLHWDPNSNFALLMLGKITAFVLSMIEDARMFDEMLCQRIEQLHAKSQ